MVHTATLSYPASSRLYQRFIDLESTSYWKQKKRYVNTSLKDFGIEIEAYILEQYKAVFTMTVNFKQIIAPEPEVYMIDVMEESDITAVWTRFNELMYMLLPYVDNDANMPLFHEWFVTRIDYCLNIKTAYVEEYMRLLSKSDKPYFCQDKKNYDGSLYLVSSSKNVKNRSSTINFYDKHKQLIAKRDKKNDNRITEAVLVRAENVLRLEVQCHKTKTDRIAKNPRYGFIHGKRIVDFLSEQICHDVVEEALNRVTKYATFHRSKIAEQMIDGLNCRKPKKEALKQLLADVNTQHQSIDKVRLQYAKSGIMTKETFNTYLNYLEENDINAVTISDNTKLQDKTTRDGLKPVYELFFMTAHRLTV